MLAVQMVRRADRDRVNIVTGQQLVQRLAEERHAEALALGAPFSLIDVPQGHHLGAWILLVAADVSLGGIPATAQHPDADLPVPARHTFSSDSYQPSVISYQPSADS